MKRSHLWALAIIVLLAFAGLVWPTVYRYDHFKRGAIEMPVRINRFTGRTECFVGRTVLVPGDTNAQYDSMDHEHAGASFRRRTNGYAVPVGWSSDCYR